MTILVLNEREEAIVKLASDRRLAHKIIFSHRDATPAFHGEIIDRFHSKKIKNSCEKAFRGAAKSTLAEEAMVIMAGLREFGHAMIVGASIERAAERLHAIRRHIEKNEQFITLFGDLKGRPWGDELIELNTGITIQAMGRGQAIRGTKNVDWRPDFILCDDIEDRQSMSSLEGTEKIQSWFFSDLIPSGDEPVLRVRVLCNDMGVNSLGNRLKAPDSGFEVHEYPWVYKDAMGEDRAIWPERFPLETIERKRKQMFAMGRHADYNQEYLCRSETPEDKPFKRDMIRVDPIIRTWHMTQACFDPARTNKSGSCDTGFACWSWIGNRLVIWDAWGKKLLPDEIITSIFDCNEIYKPSHIGVDDVGLSEFIRQPIRQEQIRRGVTIPFKAVPAAKSKFERIRSLQPFFAAHEVSFSKPIPDLEKQLLSFPLGQKDILDALAYSLVMRPGQPIYEDFTVRNVMDGLVVTPATPAWLCLNASPAMTVGILVQLVDNGVRVFADWVREGDPASTVQDIIQSAGIEAQRSIKLICPPPHFEMYSNTGLVQACRKINMEVRKGTPMSQGVDQIRQYLRRMVKGLPALMVSPNAGWSVNGLSGAYCRGIDKRTGALSDYAEEGPYRLLIEALESFMGLTRIGSPDEDDDGNWQTSRDGRAYKSALRNR